MQDNNRITLEKSQLFKNIESLVIREVNNSELRKNINKIFGEKKLNENTIYCLFNNSKEIKDLETIEQIAIAKVCYEYKDRSNSYDYTKYFSVSEINEFESYISTEEKIKVMEFKDFRKINDSLYRGNCTYVDLCRYFENMLIIYNIDTQRANTIKKLGNTIIRKPSIDKKTVESIKNAILEGKFEDTEIVLNVRMIEGKYPRFEFKPKYRDMLGDIKIMPQYHDLEDKMFTVVDILDGYHRILAIKAAIDQYYQENNEYLEGSIGIKIVFADTERGLRIVEQTFKRSNTDKQFLDAIATNDYTLLVDDIIKNSKKLKNNIARTYDECIAFNKITHKAILNRTVEYLKISSDNVMARNFESKKYSKLIDEYVDVVEYKINKENIDKYINPNIFAGVIAFGKKCFDYEMQIGIDEIEKLVYFISEIKIENIKKMKLLNKNCNISKIVENFGGVIK